MVSKMVSIIVPVYNIEKYLDDCIDSILKQVYQKIEVVLVDDGSDDGSSEKCDEWKKRDGRIKVIHQKNQGLSAARNAGIKEAEGEYILLVDGDDVIHPQMVELLLDIVIKHGCKIAFCEYEKFSDTTEIEKQRKERQAAFHVEIVSSEEYLIKLLCYKVRDVVWNGLYHRDIVLQNKFIIGKRNEDVWWKYLAIDAADEIASISNSLYYYRQREGSIMSTFCGLKVFDDLEGRYYRAAYIADKYPALKTLAFSEVIAACMNFYIYTQKYLSGKEQMQGFNMINIYRQFATLGVFEVLREKNMSRMRKISVIIQKVSFRLACYLKVIFAR
ncbi:MAG: glycosyltransferase [Fusicatenibacter sp.]|nr:glycosyltransferase [Fusicatenibacter sp.]